MKWIVQLESGVLHPVELPIGLEVLAIGLEVLAVRLLLRESKARVAIELLLLEHLVLCTDLLSGNGEGSTSGNAVGSLVVSVLGDFIAESCASSYEPAAHNGAA